VAAIHWKSVRGTFLVLGCATSTVPCLQLLVAPEWWPPDSALFRVAATIVAAGALGIVFLCAGLVRRVRVRRVAVGCAAAIVCSLVLLFWYDATLRRAVHRVQWQDSPRVAVVIPLGISGWIDDALLHSVQTVPGPAYESKTRATVTDDDIVAALTYWGPPDVLPHIPAGARTRTVALLVTQYAAAITLLTVAFGVLGLRVGWAPGETPEPEAKKEGGAKKAAEPGEAEDDDAGPAEPPRPRKRPARRKPVS
jgi:hypothetical protein